MGGTDRTMAQARGGLAAAHRRRLMSSAALAVALGGAPLAARAAGPGGAAPALPTGGAVTAGAATIGSPAGGALSIRQTSSRAVINWSTFSIGQGASVAFDNGSGATLNRVASGAPVSALNGALSATGSVYLINPSGVIVGKSGVVNVGGTFVASTQNITDGGFMAGGALTFSGTSDAAVLNYGRIGALGGDVVLIASRVENQGAISAPNGAAGLLAGYQVLLKDKADADGHFSVLVGGTGASATNAGAISAAAAELRAEQGNVYALAGNTTGVIRATEVSGAGGDIRLVAPGGTVQVASGAVLDASAGGASGDGGHVLVDSADTTFAGTALARGGAAGGDGGLVETSGTQVNFTGARIDTTAAAGRTGQWLVDPTDLTIDFSNNTTLSAALATNNVTLQTNASGASGIGTQTSSPSAKGDINIDAPVSWSSANTLTLQAYHSIYVNAPVTISGTGAAAGALVMTTAGDGTTLGGDLFFGGAGGVQFTGGGFPAAGLSGHLTINGVNYTLENTFAALQAAINGNLTGDYALADSVSAGSFVGAPLANGGYLSGGNLMGVGFTGALEGLGNTVSGLTITAMNSLASTQVFTGLLGYLGPGGIVRDIGVSGANISTTDSNGGSDATGALVGENLGQVINSWSSGSVSGSGVGGLVGTNGSGGLVQGSHSSASVTALTNPSNIVAAGGLVGTNGDGGLSTATINQSYATGAVSDGGTTADIGGLVGWNVGPGLISQSYATGTVASTTAGSSEVGGLVGENDDRIADSYAQGAVSGQNPGVFVGGLAGANLGTISTSYSSGQVTGAPGFAGASIGADMGVYTDVYYDASVNPALSATSSGPAPDISGMTTSSLQNGMVPGGFGSAWGVASGFYPFLNFQYPHGAVKISGTVFSGYDASPVTSPVTVALSSYGSVMDSARTNGSGAYALLADGGQQSEVLLSGGASHANTYLGAPTGAVVANLYEGYLRLPSASASLSSTLAGVALAVGNNSGADYLYTLAGGLAPNASLDILTGGGFVFDTALNAGTGTVSISAGGAVTQTAALAAANLALLGSGASYSLTNIGNSIGVLAANAGTVLVVANGALSVGTVNGVPGVTSSGAVSLTANGNLSLASSVTAGAGSDVTLAATGDFLNSAGAAAVQVSGGGSWLIYSVGPTNDVFDNLDSNNTAVWDTPAGGFVGVSGNRYVFAFRPTLTFTSTSDSKTYGTDASTQIQSDFTVSAQPGVANAYLGDTASALYSGAPVLSSSGAAASAQVSGGPYAITVAQGTVTTSDGYVFGPANSGVLTITPLALTASLVGPVSKVYDGNTAAALTAANYTLSSPIGSDSVSLVPANSGTYDTKDVGTGKTVSVAGLSLTGANADDYSLASTSISGAVGAITPLALTASLTGPVSKVYDGATAATLASGEYTLSTVIGGDTIGLSAANGGYDTKDAGTGKTVTFSGLSLTGADAGDYSLAATSISGAVGVITPLALTASLTGSVSKVYDGATAASLTSANYTLSNPIGMDAVSLVPVTSGTYDTKDAGTGKTVSVTGLSLTGAEANDYSLASTSISGAVGVITPLALTATLVGPVGKVYDGNTAASLTSANYTLSSPIGGDAVSLVPVTSGTYDTKDVGTGKTVSVAGLSLAGADAGDYSLAATSLSGAVGAITPLALTATLVGSVGKVYDGNTAAALIAANYTLSNPIGMDAVSLVPVTSGTYDTKDAGTGKTVSVAGLSLTGADAGDYSLAATSISGAVGVITPLALTASLVGPVSKVYDGTTAATLTAANYALSNPIGGDAVSLVPVTSGTYDTKDVGTGKTVSVAGLSLTGADAGDYSLAATSISGAVGVVTPLALTASLVGPVGKVYDGTTAASLTSANYTLSSPIGSDAVSLVPVTSGTYDTKDAGTGKTVSVAGLSLTGADASDYSLAATSISGAVGVITPLALTASLVGPVGKVYDGNTAASLTSANYTLSSPIGSDAVSLVPVTSGTYDTKDVGTGKTVSVAGLSLTGADANDYSLASTAISGAVGVITPLALTASLTGPVTKVYDGTTAATLASGEYTLATVINGDAVGLSAAGGGYDTKDAGTGKTVTFSGLSLTGAQASDYSLAATSISGAIGVITPLALTASLTGPVSKVYDGTATASLAPANYVLSGLVAGDSVALNDPAFGTYDTKDVGTGKTVAVTGLALTGAEAGDYTVASSISGAVGVITPLALTANLTGPVSRVYNGTTTASLAPANYVLSGLVAGDSVALNDPAFGTYDTKDVGTGKTVTVTGLALTGANAADYSVAATVAAPVGVVTPLALAATLTGPVSRAYNGTTTASLAPANYVLSGLVAGDSVALNDPAFGTYDTKDAGTGKVVAVTGLALTGANAADYSVAGSVSAPVGTITPLALSAALTGSVSRVYDGTTTASLASANYVLSGLVAGDSVALNDPAFGTYDTKDAGTGKVVTVAGLALTGANAADYSVAATVSAPIGTITPLALSAGLTGSVVKPYDGTATAFLTPGNYVLSGTVAGDSVALNDPATGTYDTKDVGTGKTVTVTGLALTGANASDYAVAGSVSAPIGTILAAAPTNLVFAPANAQSSNSDNGAAQFTSPPPGSTPSGAAIAPAGPPAADLSQQGPDESGAPYPDNRRYSDNIRFTVGTNP